jgi:hypothetical protein
MGVARCGARERQEAAVRGRRDRPSGRQADTTLGATGLENLATVPGGVPRTETMGTGALHPAGLKCLFHFVFLLGRRGPVSVGLRSDARNSGSCLIGIKKTVKSNIQARPRQCECVAPVDTRLWITMVDVDRLGPRLVRGPWLGQAPLRKRSREVLCNPVRALSADATLQPTIPRRSGHRQRPTLGRFRRHVRCLASDGHLEKPPWHFSRRVEAVDAGTVRPGRREQE